MSKKTAVLFCILCFIAAIANGTIVQHLQGVSITGDAVDFSSYLTIANDTLTIQLFNNSSVTTNSPDDLLTSYFFEIKNSNGQRPTLNYISASGDVYQTNKNSADSLTQSNANLKAVNAGDNTWQYKALNSSYNPFADFGLSTVGNSIMTPNNFNGNITGNMDYSIYAGDIYTQNLNGKLLVKTKATFVFSGLTGFTEADIKPIFGFGMGTSPDKILAYTPPVPEPATISFLVMGAIAVLRKRLNRK